MIRIGTAGWTIPADMRPVFRLEGTQLERYASQMNCVEINSSFYRPHRPNTYARWAASVGETFSFSLKIPKEITHVRRCVDCEDLVARFLAESAALGEKRAVLLLQLPPSFAFDPALIDRFLTTFRERYDGFAVCEPRHASWLAGEAHAVLRAHRIGRVAADPAVLEAAASPGGWEGIAYYRQHGSPRTYYSRYEPPRLSALAAQLAGGGAPERWCIFDNTAAGAALGNAREVAAFFERASAGGALAGGRNEKRA